MVAQPEAVCVTVSSRAVTRTYLLTHVLILLSQESQTLRTRVAALESTGSEGLAQLVRGAGTREAEGSKVEKA